MVCGPLHFNNVSVRNAHVLGYTNPDTNTGHGNRACGVNKIQGSSCVVRLKKQIPIMLIMDKLLIMIIPIKRIQTKLLSLCLVLAYLFKPENLLLNTQVQVFILKQVHPHHLSYLMVNVEVIMIVSVLESVLSLGITLHLDLGLPVQVIVGPIHLIVIIHHGMNLLVVTTMNAIYLLIVSLKNSTSLVIVIDVSQLLMTSMENSRRHRRHHLAHLDHHQS